MSLPPGWRWRQRLTRVRRALKARFAGPRTVYVTERRDEYRRYWEAAATALGARFAAVTDRVWEVRLGERVTRVSGWVTQCDNPVVLRLAGDKAYCYRLAASLGVPVPRHVVVRPGDLTPAVQLLGSLGSVVVKPLKGSASGLGITTHVRSPRALHSAAVLASTYDDEILVEETVAAESCRLLFLNGRLLGAVRRRGTRVTGDGASTLADLLRRAGIRTPAADPGVAATLAAAGRRLEDRPAAGEVVLGSSLPPAPGPLEELRTVYDEDITDQVAPALVAELAAVVRALGSEFAGVDILTADPTRSLAGSGGTFLEINTTPGLHHHYLSVERLEQGPAVAVLRYLLDNHGTAAPAAGQFRSPTPGAP